MKEKIVSTPNSNRVKWLQTWNLKNNLSVTFWKNELLSNFDESFRTKLEKQIVTCTLLLNSEFQSGQTDLFTKIFPGIEINNNIRIEFINGGVEESILLFSTMNSSKEKIEKVVHIMSPSYKDKTTHHHHSALIEFLEILKNDNHPFFDLFYTPSPLFTIGTDFNTDAYASDFLKKWLDLHIVTNGKGALSHFEFSSVFDNGRVGKTDPETTTLLYEHLTTIWAMLNSYFIKQGMLFTPSEKSSDIMFDPVNAKFKFCTFKLMPVHAYETIMGYPLPEKFTRNQIIDILVRLR